MPAPIRVMPRGADLIKAIEALPPLPAVALRVIQVAQDPKASASDLSLIVSADPGLSARILRIANSAAYRRSREVTSVQDALVVLGFVQARNLAVSSAITSAYSPDALHALFRIDTFWRHSITVAFRAAELATKCRKVDIPSAYTAGILHNMGRLAMFYSDPAGLDQAVAEALRSGRPLADVEDELLGYNHAELGGLLAIKWRLPADIRDAIARHNQVELPDGSLASLVAQAAAFCTRNGLFPGYVVPPPAGSLRDVTPDFRHLAERVEELMALVHGSRV
jgi:HD-like signal output (HDOD) protein